MTSPAKSRQGTRDLRDVKQRSLTQGPPLCWLVGYRVRLRGLQTTYQHLVDLDRRLLTRAIWAGENSTMTYFTFQGCTLREIATGEGVATGAIACDSEEVGASGTFHLATTAKDLIEGRDYLVDYPKSAELPNGRTITVRVMGLDPSQRLSAVPFVFERL